ncbi:MAG: (2E,6E)-farnesyl diphosphate synthase [Burkholderiaceae bacterium]
MLERFERAADRRLPAASRVPTRLHEAMRYAVLDGGKRVRPLLVYAAGEVSAAAPAALDCAALAVEYVHAYSLIHDDLPCMDDDVLRRGKPTVHIAFDEATAMLAGDALQAEAFKVLVDAPLPPAVCAALMRELAHAAGTEGMCGGQAIDLAAVGQEMSADELERMHRMKTGALLHASVRMGALAGAADEATLAAINAYGRAIGLAFQIVDDVLDVEGSSEVLGKTAGKDARQAKPTYVSVLGLDAAKARAERLRVEAADAIAGLGPSALRLRQLADFIVLRSH